jgi:hypothetical protein
MQDLFGMPIQPQAYVPPPPPPPPPPDPQAVDEFKIMYGDGNDVPQIPPTQVNT